MFNLIYSSGVLLLTLVVYKIISGISSRRHHARRAKELGCQPAFQRPYNLPFGIDMALRLIKADKEQRVPDEVERVYHEVGHDTFEQNFLGTPNFVTFDPKNIQALLATQFNDFEIGAARRGNFFPMFGNGIFTSDGKSWYKPPLRERVPCVSTTIANPKPLTGNTLELCCGHSSLANRCQISNWRKSMSKTCFGIFPLIRKGGQNRWIYPPYSSA